MNTDDLTACTLSRAQWRRIAIERGEALAVALAEVARLGRELDRVRAELADAQARRTLGGIPPVPDQTWANLAYTTPPATSVDETAPPLYRQTRSES